MRKNVRYIQHFCSWNNFRCIYCHREGQLFDSNVELSAEEIKRIVSIAASLGVYSVKLTGGEPLLRKDIVEIVRGISSIPGIKDISMTTNGFFLKEYAKQLKDAGLSRVNVSLDTLNAEKFKFITGVDAHKRIMDGIVEAARVGLNPIKINMVLLKGINCDEVEDMIKFTEENQLILQLIELEGFWDDPLYIKYHADLDDIEKKVRERSLRVIVRQMHHRKKYILKGGAEVEIVKPMHNTEFCLYCNRIRLTSDGKLKPCLFRNDNLIDLLGPMRSGADDNYLKDLFIEAVRRRRPFFM
ncbi:MAG: GTP 3',8-cyclase MoaA [Candidatus Bathyarchaeia archaeon]